jgi:hypothetical protein
MKLVLLHDVRLVAQGSITGRKYEWNGAGSVIDVADEDAEELFKKRTKQCLTFSGSLVVTPYFELAR